MGWELPWIPHSAFPTPCSNREQSQPLWCLFPAGFSVPTPIPCICAISEVQDPSMESLWFQRHSELIWEEPGNLSHLWLLRRHQNYQKFGNCLLEFSRNFGNSTQFSPDFLLPQISSSGTPGHDPGVTEILLLGFGCASLKEASGTPRSFTVP